MKDELDIPDFLDLRIPANLERWKEARRNWRPNGSAARAAEPKVNRDRAGNILPRGMDESSWAFLAQLEKADREKDKVADAEKDERFRVLAVQRREKAAIRRAAKEASEKARETFS